MKRDLMIPKVTFRVRTGDEVETDGGCAIGGQWVNKTTDDYFKGKRVVIFSGGTGNPFFTTDSAAVLRGIEINADVILKGTRVDGIYNLDPEKNKDAIKFEHLTFDDAITKNLKVMDSTAFTLSKENKLPIIVFDMNTKGNLKKIINGEKKSGVTIHELTPEIDGGNIVIQKEFELLNEYTAQDVLDKNVDVASKLLPNLIKGIEQNSLSPIKQVKLGNEYICKLRKYEDGEILKGMSVKNIYDMARALADPWPGVFYFDKNEKIILNNKISMSKAEKIFKIINC